MGSTNLRRTEEEWRGQDRNRLKKTERKDQTKPSTNTNNTDFFMRALDIVQLYYAILDIVKLYYAMNIKNTMQKYLVTILPWEKYVYLKIPMGLNISADISQRKISRLFQGMPFVLIYIDDINQRIDFNCETHRLIIKTKTKRQRKK